MTAGKQVHAFTDDDVLGDADAVELADRIRSGQVSAKEAADAAIARVQKVNPELNAVVADCFDDYAPQTVGPLAGVPTFVKDNTDVAGLPTKHGSAAITSRPATRTEPFARQYLSAGFTVLGKTTLPEFGFSAATEFRYDEPTRNPWNTAFSPGASSGGSAALVAAGAVPIAHANDGGGSIRIPAAACGLVGLKPTRNRFYATEYAKHAPVNIVANGVVTRTVRDTAAFLAAAETYRPAKGLKPIGKVSGPSDRRLRIGLITSTVTGADVDADTLAAVTATATRLEKLGHTVDPVALPVGPRFADDFVDYWSLLAFAATTTGKLAFGLDFDPSKCDGLTRGLAARFQQRVAHMPLVLARLLRISGQTRGMFKHHDVILSPVLAHTTPEIGFLSPHQPFDQLIERLRHYVGFTPLNNVAGVPGLSLPLGVSTGGLPVGVHFTTTHGDERTLLELAFELEADQPFPVLHSLGAR